MLSLNHTVVHFTRGRLERVHIACFMLENWCKFLIWKGGLQKRTGIHKRDSNEGNFLSGMLPSLVQQFEVILVAEAALPCQNPSVVWWNASLGGWKQLLLIYIFKTNTRGLAAFQRVWSAQASVSLLPSPLFLKSEDFDISRKLLSVYWNHTCLDHNLCILLTQASFFSTCIFPLSTDNACYYLLLKLLYKSMFSVGCYGKDNKFNCQLTVRDATSLKNL